YSGACGRALATERARDVQIPRIPPRAGEPRLSGVAADLRLGFGARAGAGGFAVRNVAARRVSLLPVLKFELARALQGLTGDARLLQRFAHEARPSCCCDQSPFGWPARRGGADGAWSGIPDRSQDDADLARGRLLDRAVSQGRCE